MFDTWTKKSNQSRRPNPDQSFHIWIDRVGGYLVCPNRSVWIGQAIPQSGIDIPVLGDLRRRHARIELREGEHIISPAGNVKIDGSEKPSGWCPLTDGQEIQFGDRVRLKYAQPHPLSQTARLDFTSGNRTSPWSDGVLLMAQTIIIGPSSKNHIYCSDWEKTLVLFRRQNQWMCRTSGEFEIDHKLYQNEGPIYLDSTISGDDFSLTLEPVSSGESQT